MVTSAEDPNLWGVPELFSISLFVMLYLFSIAFSIWKSFRSDRKRLYWIACASLIIIGTLTMLFFAFPDSPNSGEMPPEYGLGVWIVFVGLFGVIAGVLSSIFYRFFRKQTSGLQTSRLKAAPVKGIRSSNMRGCLLLLRRTFARIY